MRIEEHSLRSRVGKGSEWDCLLGQLDRILDISDSVAGQKVPKWRSEKVDLKEKVSVERLKRSYWRGRDEVSEERGEASELVDV